MDGKFTGDNPHLEIMFEKKDKDARDIKRQRVVERVVQLLALKYNTSLQVLSHIPVVTVLRVARVVTNNHEREK